MNIIWGISIVFIFVLLFVNFTISKKENTFKNNVKFLLFFIILSLIFSFLVFFIKGRAGTVNYLTGYLTELSLSFDNIFIFYIIIKHYKVPKQFQKKVLFLGIVIAMLMRFFFIVLGITIINKFSFVNYILALFLFFTSIKIAFHKEEKEKPPKGRINIFLKKHLRSIDDFSPTGKLTLVKNKKRYLTPIFFTIVLIGTIDIMFAVDSIPAVIGITKDLYIVIMVNFFSLLGLNQMYFITEVIINKIKMLNYALCVILFFIGLKIMLEELSNKISVPKISNEFSLAFVIFCFVLTFCIDKIKHNK